jgi:hypothetical protein
MAWARFDTQLRATLTAVEQRAPIEGARRYHRLRAHVAWAKLQAALRSRSAAPEVLARGKQLGKEAERQAEARNIIAHAWCFGTLRRDDDFLVFAPFEAPSGNGRLYLAVPIPELERSAAWAAVAADMAERIENAAEAERLSALPLRA